MERDRGGGKRAGTEPSNDHSQRAVEIPTAAMAPFQKVMFSTLPFYDLNSILARSYLPQPELVSEHKNKDNKCFSNSEMEELISSWRSVEEQCKEMYTRFQSGLPNTCCLQSTAYTKCANLQATQQISPFYRWGI